MPGIDEDFEKCWEQALEIFQVTPTTPCSKSLARWWYSNGRVDALLALDARKKSLEVKDVQS